MSQVGRFQGIFSAVIAIAVLALFILIVTSFVFSEGVCCGDDAYHAMIAKNLADGLGYTSTIPIGANHYEPVAFDPLVGTGPTAILPAAVSIKFFGNTYWAPGLAHVVSWTLMLLLIGFQIRRYNKGFGFLLATVTFFYLCFTLMTMRFELWYALFGEVPASLLVILVSLLCFRNESQVSLVLTGLVIGLAVLSKALSMLGIVVILISFLLTRMLDHSLTPSMRKEKILFSFFRIGSGFILILAIFELWKLIVLGLPLYLDRWGVFWNYLTGSGIRIYENYTLGEIYTLGMDRIFKRFGFRLLYVFPIFILGLIIVWKDRKIRLLFAVLAVTVFVYSIWWIFLSKGWPRYFGIPLMLMCFALSLPFLLSNSNKSLLVIYFLSIVVWSSSTWSHIKLPFNDLDGGIFKPSKTTKALLETANILTTVEIENKIIVTESWATAVDLEYIMDDHLVFTHYRDSSVIAGQPVWVALNTAYSANFTAFEEFLQRCEVIYEIDVYLIESCRP